jgi:hypothetical protein
MRLRLVLFVVCCVGVEEHLVHEEGTSIVAREKDVVARLAQARTRARIPKSENPKRSENEK